MKNKARADFTQDLGKDKSLAYKLIRAVFIMMLVVSIAKNVDLWLKYNRLQDVYIDTLARHTGWERDYILEAMKYSLDKVKPNIKEQRESGQIDLFPYKERSLNKEFENLNKEIEKDIEAKIDKIEALDSSTSSSKK